MEEEREVWSGWSQRQNECQGKIIARRKERKRLKNLYCTGMADVRHRSSSTEVCLSA